MNNKPFQERKKRITAIAVPRDECNFGCVYCSADKGESEGMMSDSTLERFIDSLAEYNRDYKYTNIIWHGGEPLSAGLEFYKKAVALEEEIPDHLFINSMQTNASLLTEEMCEFFREYGFKIGISLDGTRYTHNMNRPFKGGQESFDRVFENLMLARKFKIGGSSFLCVLNKNTVPHLKEIYSFQKEHHLHSRLNPQIPVGRAAGRLDLAISPEEYGESMIELFDLWFNDDTEPPLEIDPFNRIVRSSKGYGNLVQRIANDQGVLDYVKANVNGFKGDQLQIVHRVSCTSSNECFYRYIGVSAKGEVTTCNRFTGTKDFSYGNINEAPLEELMETEYMKGNPIAFRDAKNIEECAPCEYLALCQAGCSFAAYLVNGTVNSPDPFCEGYKMLFKHINKTLEDDKRWLSLETA